jgi:hypothetical protein
MGDSNLHAPNDLAALLAGGAPAGCARSAREVQAGDAAGQPAPGVLDVFGVAGVEQMGDSTGRLQQLSDLA